MKIITRFIVWFWVELFNSFPFNLLKPLGKKLPDDLWERYSVPYDN